MCDAFAVNSQHWRRITVTSEIDDTPPVVYEFATRRRRFGPPPLPGSLTAELAAAKATIERNRAFCAECPAEAPEGWETGYLLAGSIIERELAGEIVPDADLDILRHVCRSSAGWRRRHLGADRFAHDRRQIVSVLDRLEERNGELACLAEETDLAERRYVQDVITAIVEAFAGSKTLAEVNLIAGVLRVSLAETSTCPLG